MHRDERTSYLVIVVLMVVFLAWAVPTQIKNPEMASVSPRLIPQICAWAILLLAVYKWVSTLNRERLPALITVENYKLLGQFLVMLTICTVVMQWIGFWISSILITGGSMWLTGERNPRILIAFSIILVAATWLILRPLGIYLR
ncbi:MAG: tripartite tricarboxylate transporter TctB family protein [Chloroflexota bacterium]